MPNTSITTRPGDSLAPKIVHHYRNSPEPSRLQYFFGINVINKDGERWWKGYVGERKTARQLDTVPNATVLHSITVGSGGRDIDHIVIAPQGVFVINSKLRSNDVELDGANITTGKSREFLVKKMEDDARMVYNLLKDRGVKVFVKPIVSFTAWGKFASKSAHKNVAMIEYRDIAKHITSLPVDQKMQPTLEQAAAILSSPSTWQYHKGGLTDEEREEFDGILDELDRAHERKRKWGIAGLLTLLGASFTVAIGMFVWATQMALPIS